MSGIASPWAAGVLCALPCVVWVYAGFLHKASGWAIFAMSTHGGDGWAELRPSATAFGLAWSLFVGFGPLFPWVLCLLSSSSPARGLWRSLPHPCHDTLCIGLAGHVKRWCSSFVVAFLALALPIHWLGWWRSECVWPTAKIYTYTPII
ncbi:unnamed protein product [Prorocentrum cordatum]|uniref:Uncharacterized protein n=1 Tax=Prorocentrum cordatum TaxID=2364126 RepID=A0ABN9SMI9_9DINO|nr:unnamed protein product [Polarella glacialis]